MISLMLLAMYTFSGSGGLAGSFTLDEASLSGHLTGRVGTIPFTTTLDGPATLDILESNPCPSCKSHWIVTAEIGPRVAGFAPQLDLFIYVPTGQPLGLTPPPHGLGGDFTWSLFLSETNFTSGQLLTLDRVASVPEPATLCLLALGLLALLLPRRSRLAEVLRHGHLGRTPPTS